MLYKDKLEACCAALEFSHEFTIKLTAVDNDEPLTTTSHQLPVSKINLRAAQALQSLSSL